MLALLPALIALVGVVIGLAVNRAWNQRVERREVYVRFIEAYNDYWAYVTANEDKPQVDQVEDMVRLNAALYRASLLVRIIAPRAVADVAVRSAEAIDDDTWLSARNSELFLLVVRRDLAQGVRERFRLWREYRYVLKMDWFEKEFRGLSTGKISDWDNSPTVESNSNLRLRIQGDPDNPPRVFKRHYVGD